MKSYTDSMIKEATHPLADPNHWRIFVSKHTHTYPFNGPFSGTTWVSRYQKGKTNLDFTEARDSEWQWHQLGHMQVCTSLQTDNHNNTHHSVFYRPDALPAAQPTASKHWRDNFLYQNCRKISSMQTKHSVCIAARVKQSHLLTVSHAQPMAHTTANTTQKTYASTSATLQGSPLKRYMKISRLFFLQKPRSLWQSPHHLPMTFIPVSIHKPVNTLL